MSPSLRWLPPLIATLLFAPIVWVHCWLVATSLLSYHSLPLVGFEALDVRELARPSCRWWSPRTWSEPRSASLG